MANTLKQMAIATCLLPALVFLPSLDAFAARPAWSSSRIQGSPYPPEPYKLVPAFPALSFALPSSIEEIPGADRLLITEIGGRIFSFPKQREVQHADLAMDLSTSLPGVRLFDAEFHPDFSENRFLFLCYVHPTDAITRVSRFQLSANAPPEVDAHSERVIITFPVGPHNAGCLEFGPDGFLYVSTGDGAGPNPPDGLTTGQDISDLLGAILRIDVDKSTAAQPYRVPADNPFIALENARPEIWAYGLRNPFKFGIDPESGDIFAADNGWETWETVHRIVRGGNCGWPIREGRAALRTEVPPGPTPILPPVKDHHHSEANSVIGGPVYRGHKLPGLDGAFVYGDYITGTIWMVRRDRDGGYANETLVDTDQRLVAFTQGSGTELYALDYDFTGKVYELLPSEFEDSSADFPRRLSETGLFSSLANLTPAAGVVPYDVTAARWMDGAEARRWIAVPGQGQVSLPSGPRAAAEYPEGTVFVKHLWFPQTNGSQTHLETQILHHEGGQWRPYSYLWDDSKQDADLVASTGADRPFQAPSANGVVHERTWHASATNECKLCHNPGSGFVLGHTLHQLNRPSVIDPSIAQLTQLASEGVLKSVPTISEGDRSRLVDPYDSSAPLNDRARSYLHANCAMCHHPGGNAIVSFYLERGLPFDQLRTNKGTIIGTFGMEQAKIVVPGDPYRSLLFYRMSKLGYARMPYIGSRVVDSRGLTLIEQWIRSLPSQVELSPPADDSSPEASALRSLAEPGDQPNFAQSISKLLQSTEGALSLGAQLHRGSLSKSEFTTAVSLGSQASTSDIRGLFEDFLPEAERRAVLGANFDPYAILQLQGNRERGKLIFFSDSARCRTCHELDEPEKSVGPTLSEINKKYPGRSEFLQHVMQPSLKVDDKYATHTVVTDAGRVFIGLVVKQTDKEIILKTAEGKSVRFARAEIDEMRRSPGSLMPARMLSDLTAQEAADLLSYLRGATGEL